MPRSKACALGVPTVEAQPTGGRTPERCGQGVFVVIVGRSAGGDITRPLLTRANNLIASGGRKLAEVWSCMLIVSMLNVIS